LISEIKFSTNCRCGRNWTDKSVNHYEFVVPMYKAKLLIPSLLIYFEAMRRKLPCEISVIFVLDGDLDETKPKLVEALKGVDFKWKILKLSRNFGVGPAIMAAFENSNACVVTALGADLQEPEEVFLKFLTVLSDPEKHVALGVRKSRDDPYFSRKASQFYWYLFTKVISPDLPTGGFDVCALSQEARKSLCSMDEKNTNITAQIDWLGFSREFVYFDRLSRKIGKSSWKLSRKIKLFMDSFYGFTELPIVFLLILSSLGIFFSSIFGLLILTSWLLGKISVPGYVSIILLQIFSINLILFVISLISGYITRAFENSKARPKFVIESIVDSNKI
jgi:glycosyltransferase involved in cell wall biosynthesis